MAYTPYYNGGWQSGEEGGTPITPAALNHMEDGIVTASNSAVDIFIPQTVTTWAGVFEYLSTIPENHNATIHIQNSTTVQLMSNNNVGVSVKGFVSRPGGSGTFDFMVVGISSGSSLSRIFTWRISGFTSGSVTPTVNTVYRFDGTAL